ncbi:hypothetical protein NDU88_005432 [Pleurodeles waltl]|uniref:SAP domain-containing protein n=1 Tax=Pleurodeles waltl TaxID=8319 RepID=A0AAV7UI60_PLEWA|nr:hypothetical protein NDU88_005432 [Pleurodeles waltl]
MSQLGDASVEAVFDLKQLNSYNKAQLKQFCKNFGCPIKSSSKKDELKKALRAWVTTKSTGGHTEDEEEDEDEEGGQSVHNGIVGGPVIHRERVSRAGSSVSSKGLTPEELQDRQAERAYQLELQKLNLEKERDERRAVLEERKMQLAHELNLKELDQRSQSSKDGGSNPTVQPERRVHIPKDLVRDYKREDDIYLWFKGYESALHMNLVPEAHWGAALWKHFEAEGRDTLTALGDAQSLTYPVMKEALLTSLCFPELRQHLIDSKLTDPRKLAQEADRWESTRVQKRYRGDHAKGGQGPSQKKGVIGHVRGDPKCPKYTPAPTGAQSQGLASVALGEELVPGGWEPAEMTLVSLGDSEVVQRKLLPDNPKKYREWVTINGQRVEALRDTGASVTTLRHHLVSEEQIDPRALHQVVVVDNSEHLCRVAQVPFEWGGVSGCWKVAVSPTMPVDCLLGNDLEDSPWKEVEHRSHLEMLGLPGWVCVSTRSMAANLGSQEPLEPETVAQGTAKKRKGRGRRKQAPEVPAVWEEAESEGDAPEPTGEQLAELGEVPELSQWQQEGGPTREAFCTAQQECPTLEGLRQLAAAPAAGEAPGTHLIVGGWPPV